jgi:hypothetical protein
MRRKIVQKLSLLFFILIILIFVSGCETIGTMRSGDVKMSDLAQIANLGTSTTRPFNQARGADGRVAGAFDSQKKNDWFQTNYW